MLVRLYQTAGLANHRAWRRFLLSTLSARAGASPCWDSPDKGSALAAIAGCLAVISIAASRMRWFGHRKL